MIPLSGRRIAALAVLAVASRADAQSQLHGEVRAGTRTGPPIAQAEVSVAGIGVATRTDSLGRFAIGGIRAGRFGIQIRHIGHRPVVTEVEFSGRDTVEMTAILSINPTILDTVNVQARIPGKFAEFHDRRRTSTGSFMTRADLARHRDRPLAEALSRLPGLRVMRMGGGSAAIATSRGEIRRGASGGDAMDRRRGAAPACYSQVILDNVPIFEPKAGAPLFNINSLPVETIEGIEYYASSARTPARYSRYAGCGTLVIWTRIE